MPATLPVPLEFRPPEDWLVAPAEENESLGVAFAAVHPRPDEGFAANITIDGGFPLDGVTPAQLADASVEQLREGAGSVEVVDRREVGSGDAPALTQRLAISAVVDGTLRDLVQSQVYLFVVDERDPHRRGLVRIALTATAAQHDAVLGDFQEFLRTVRPDVPEEA
ncbi:hypothetical protein GCM10010503_31890 [Streptomyces lucensis JCM 4490]|uniref:DUF1795 domain-containing protein n=1 Tax=Streptomyces lucensis JCM 4490 TaxID=1306176 RepID=A0A918MRY4_9ACTN|nr:hypothetical protein [Streptomyces lucensis]GGW52467.1 hypothetical protein GCM10010503_31890 [Streptomyces lucensis JCM 4490]